MNREAFEAEARKHGFILDRLDKSGVYVQLITEQAWSTWQAATAAALERAAEEVEKIDKENWFAWQCDFSKHAAEAIRALKESKE